MVIREESGIRGSQLASQQRPYSSLISLALALGFLLFPLSGCANPGYADPGYADNGHTDPGHADTRHVDPGHADPRHADNGHEELSTPTPTPTLKPIAFTDLPGWPEDDLAEALKVFRLSCPVADHNFQNLCAKANTTDVTHARYFFEQHFTPHLVQEDDNSSRAFFTGYFEPMLRGSTTPDRQFHVPLYRFSEEGASYPRQDIEQGVLAGRGDELIWVDDPIEAFFLSIQGSGRVRLQDGSILRLGYAGRNRHPYVSIGTILVRRHGWKKSDVSLFSIQRWLQDNPKEGRRLMWENPAYIFFRILEGSQAPPGSPGSGPLGSLGVALSPGRSLAVDRHHIPLGSALWVITGKQSPRMMIAQDTGSAIKGRLRGDIFHGIGAQARKRAGYMREYGQYYLLLPKSSSSTELMGGKRQKPS